MPVDFTLRTLDGQNLSASHWQAKKPCLLLLWLHGYAEHRLRYSHFASWMTEKQVSVAAVDLRGHGHSTGPRGFVRRYEEYIRDVEAFVNHMVERSPDLPMVVGAHSNGALALTRYAQSTHFNPKILGLVTTSPYFGLAWKVPAWKKILVKVILPLSPRLTVPSNLDKATLTHDTEIMKQRKQDPLMLKEVSARWVTEAQKHQRLAMKETEKIKIPFLLMQGMEDKLASVSINQEFFEKLQTKKHWIGYPKMYHEILNEIERQKVYVDMYNWLSSFASRS